MLYPTELRAQNQGICPLQPDEQNGYKENGRGREIRTPDILLPKQARYQTALYPDIKTLRPAKSASLRGRILLTALLTVNVESAALSGTFLSSARLPLLLQTPRPL
jgi:hypothetical protein